MEAVNVESFIDKALGDMNGKDFGNDKVVLSDALKARQRTFQARVSLGNTRNGNDKARSFMKAGGSEFAVAGGKIRGCNVHGLHQFFSDKVYYELARGGDILYGVLGLPSGVVADADHNNRGLSAHQVEETEGGKIESATGIARCDPGDGTRYDQAGQQLISKRGVLATKI
jgi:hypothetical protein